MKILFFFFFTIFAFQFRLPIRNDLPNFKDLIRDLHRMPIKRATSCNLGVNCSNTQTFGNSTCEHGFCCPGLPYNSGTCVDSSADIELGDICSPSLGDSSIANCNSRCKKYDPIFSPTCNSETETCAWQLDHGCPCVNHEQCGGTNTDRTRRCIQGVCDFIRGDGEICTNHEHCASKSCQMGQCAGILPNQNCTFSSLTGSPCTSGHYCKVVNTSVFSSNQADGSLGICTPFLNLEDDCDLNDLFNEACGMNICDLVNGTFGKCREIFAANLGDQCYLTYRCKISLTCNRTQCVPYENGQCAGSNDVFSNTCPILEECVCVNGLTECSQNYPLSIVQSSEFDLFATRYYQLNACLRINNCTLDSAIDFPGSCANKYCSLESNRLICSVFSPGIIEGDDSDCGYDCSVDPPKAPSRPPCCTGLSCMRDATCQCYDNTCKQIFPSSSSKISLSFFFIFIIIFFQ